MPERVRQATLGDNLKFVRVTKALIRIVRSGDGGVAKEDIIMMESSSADGGGWRRGGRERMTLTIIIIITKTKKKPLGFILIATLYTYITPIKNSIKSPSVWEARGYSYSNSNSYCNTLFY